MSGWECPFPLVYGSGLGHVIHRPRNSCSCSCLDEHPAASPVIVPNRVCLMVKLRVGQTFFRGFSHRREGCIYRLLALSTLYVSMLEDMPLQWVCRLAIGIASVEDLSAAGTHSISSVFACIEAATSLEQKTNAKWSQGLKTASRPAQQIPQCSKGSHHRPFRHRVETSSLRASQVYDVKPLAYPSSRILRLGRPKDPSDGYHSLDRGRSPQRNHNVAALLRDPAS